MSLSICQLDEQNIFGLPLLVDDVKSLEYPFQLPKIAQ